MSDFSPFFDELCGSIEEIGFTETTCNCCNSVYFSAIESAGNTCCYGGTASSDAELAQEAVRLSHENILGELSVLADLQDNINIVPPLHIMNGRRNPLFITAGVQVVDPVMHDEAEFTKSTSVVAQPSVRLNFIGRTALDKAYYTSFINTAFVQVEANTRSHLASLHTMLSLLGRLGIPTEDVALKYRENQNDWGDGSFDSRIIDVLYQGVGIGDAVLLQGYPQTTRASLMISDVSFGVERLMFAVNKQPVEMDMFDQQMLADPVVLDLLKTLTLLVGSGVFPSSSYNHGRKTRELVKLLSQRIAHEDRVDFALETYWRWWSQFTQLDVSPEDVEVIIREELDLLRGLIQRRSYVHKLRAELSV